MALITFLSDFGLSDHYVASVKADILSLDSNLTIVDISHQVGRFNIAHGAYLLSQVFKEFPKETVHLVSVGSNSKNNAGYIAMELDGHFFVGPNNGILSMIMPTSSGIVVDLHQAAEESTFPTKKVLAPVAAALASGIEIQKLGKPCANFVRLIARQVKATKGIIAGNVLRVDHYGNLITNIERKTFAKLCGDRLFSIAFGRESSSQIHQGYGNVEEGDCFVLFNTQGLLEIGINTGSAAELLGLEVDSPVTIQFHENST